VAGGTTKRRRSRGEIEELPSGSLRVRVYAGIDPITGRRHYPSWGRAGRHACSARGREGPYSAPRGGRRPSQPADERDGQPAPRPLPRCPRDRGLRTPATKASCATTSARGSITGPQPSTT